MYIYMYTYTYIHTYLDPPSSHKKLVKVSKTQAYHPIVLSNMISRLQTGYGLMATQIQEQGRRIQRRGWKRENARIGSLKDIRGLETQILCRNWTTTPHWTPLVRASETENGKRMYPTQQATPNIRRNPGVAGSNKLVKRFVCAWS